MGSGINRPWVCPAPGRRRSARVRECFAGVAELADAQDLGSCDASRGGSSPSARTTRMSCGVPSDQSPRAAGVSEIEKMQVTETSTSGLKRELKVVIGQSELGERFQSRLDEVKDQVQLKGFRKGKVPVAHLKKLFGRSMMAEVVQQAVEETSRKAISDRNERPAHQPTIGFGEDNGEMEKVLTGEGDLSYT